MLDVEKYATQREGTFEAEDETLDGVCLKTMAAWRR